MIPAPVDEVETAETPDIAVAGVGRGVLGGADDGCFHSHGCTAAVNIGSLRCGQGPAVFAGESPLEHGCVVGRCLLFCLVDLFVVRYFKAQLKKINTSQIVHTVRVGSEGGVLAGHTEVTWVRGWMD